MYPTTFFLAASAGLAIGTLVVNNAYNKKREEYQNATELSEFDEAYDAANNLNKVRIVLASLTGVAREAEIMGVDSISVNIEGVIPGKK